VSIAGTLRSDQGGILAANWNAPVALVSAALGRPAAVAGTTVPISLVEPGQVWGDRVNAFFDASGATGIRDSSSILLRA
jgi:hypothetical protein